MNTQVVSVTSYVAQDLTERQSTISLHIVGFLRSIWLTLHLIYTYVVNILDVI